MALSRAKLPPLQRMAWRALAGLLASALGIDPAGAVEWTAAASDGVDARIEALPSSTIPAERLEFDFHGGAGFALAGRTLPLDFPDNFEIAIALRSSAGGNNVELKFVDPGGDNVWWYRPPPGRITGEWQTLRIKQRQIEFAWGPAADHRLAHSARVEIAVHAGNGIAHGTLDIGAITLTSLPPPPATWPVARVTSGPAPDGTPAHVWRCASGRAACALDIDYGLMRELGGLRLGWSPNESPSKYSVALSSDGSSWRTAREITHGTGPVDWLWLGATEARIVRVSLEGAAARDVTLVDAGLLDVGVGENVNEFIATVAKAGRRGSFPRGFSEQSYWTLVGRDGGFDTGLLSEDGALELGRGAPSIEPFVVENGRVVTWADVTSTPRLEEGYLPIPTVEWQSEHFALEVSAVANEGPTGEGLWARYRLHNRTGKPLKLRLALAVRPFQVNPPAQFLTTPGGVSPIAHAEWDGRAVVLDHRWRIETLAPPDAANLYAFESGAVPELLGQPGANSRELDDPVRLGSAALAYDLDLPPGGRKEIGVFVPWPAHHRGAAARTAASPARLRAAFHAASSSWQHRLNRVTVRAVGSSDAREVSDALRTALAHIILSRSGPLLRPGTRAYARSWIRDGAMMSDALLRLGERQLPRDYLAAYSRYLFANGKVPCCVDERGADPVPENDSPGEFIHLAAAVLKATGDEALLRSIWPGVRAATGYLDALRALERPKPGVTADAAFAGLLPPSISHEGYSAKPMHSYWDDFWGLRGYSDAVYIASRLGFSDEATAFEAARLEFAHDVLASIDAVTRRRGLDYIPGAADLGDFDATSTTVAMSPGIGNVALPPGLLASTFERYWQSFVARRDGTLDWHDYTPYEWRVVGSFVRLGEPARAQAALRFFMDGRRPAGWRQWPEVIDRDPRHARFIGDLPHGWVASDFIRSVLDLFAFERESDDSVVLAAGLPAAWLAGEGVTVSGLLTRAGPVNYRLSRAGARTELKLLAGSSVPPGGFVFREPGHSAGATLLRDGRPARFENGELRIERVPARITLIDQ